MTGKYIGLAFLGGGFLLLIGYGLYNIFKELTNVDPVVLTAILAIVIGIVILLISTAMDRKSEELKEIKREDLRP